MPQTVTVVHHAHITLALNDLCTINITGRSAQRNLLVKCSGPGVAWLSLNAAQNATVGNAGCFALKTGESVTFLGFRDSVLTMNADTASTIVDLALTG